jgi:subtilase family serine protease
MDRARSVLTALAAPFLAVVSLSLFGQAALAGEYKPHSIRVDKAVITPETTPHFGCELRSFTSANVACYGPDAMRKAYSIDQLIASGFDGRGQTIVIIDAYGSPTLDADLTAFSTLFGLPPPPSLVQIHMPGSTPFNYLDDNQLGWAEETSLDVQWAHAMAPGAKIIVVAAVDNSDDAILAAQDFAIDHRLGYIISESFGESELALLQAGKVGKKILHDNEESYQRAGDKKISVLVSSGDDGSAGTDIDGNFQPFPVANYPASSPNVTTVGGTNLFFGTATNADPNGTYQGEVVWNDGYGAGGGGISGTFESPDWQDNLVPKSGPKNKRYRGYPDVALNAGVRTGVIVYLGFLEPALGVGANGFYVFGGTSASAPQWAGIVAIANQKKGRPLGFLNERIYSLGKQGKLRTVMHDITVGDNSIGGIPGYSAAKGWDLATGWGTPKNGFVSSLVHADDDNGHGDD